MSHSNTEIAEGSGLAAAASSQGARTHRLPHICGELLSFGLGLRRATDPGNAEQIRTRVAGFLTKLDSAAADAGYSAADVQLAKYALVSYLDEIVLGSHWDARTDWASRPLQLEYFNDFTAGETFYLRLEELRRSASATSGDVLEVYALCLGLGFRGKYGGLDGAERLTALRGELARELDASAVGRAAGPQFGGQKSGSQKSGGQKSGRLSPHWQGDTQSDASMKDLPVWIVVASVAAVLLVVFLILDLILGSQLGPVVDAFTAHGAGGGR